MNHCDPLIIRESETVCHACKRFLVPGRWVPFLSGQRKAEGVVLLRDFAWRRQREMRPEHQYSRVGVTLAERPPRLLCHRPVGVEIVVPFGIAALNRMMHQITGNDPVLTLGGDAHGKMTGSMAGR